MALEQELATFNKNLPDWLQTHEGKFVLVVGEELVGVFDNPQAAYEAGIQRFGNIAMLIREVRREDETAFFPALNLGLIHADPPR